MYVWEGIKKNLVQKSQVVAMETKPLKTPDHQIINVAIIVAASKIGLIGVNGEIPWNILADILRFKSISAGTKKLVFDKDSKTFKWKDVVPDPKKPNICFMGRQTADGIPEKFFPLKGRINVIITKKKKTDLGERYRKEGVYVVDSYKEFYDLLKTTLKGKYEDIFICGGKQIYQDFLKFQVDGFRLEKVFLTRIQQEIPTSTQKTTVVEELSLNTKLCKDGSLPTRWFDEFLILDHTAETNEDYEFLDYVRK